MVDNSTPTRLGKDFQEFIQKYKNNRIKADIDSKPISSEKVASLIVKYFKLNNQCYVDLVHMEVKECLKP